MKYSEVRLNDSTMSMSRRIKQYDVDQFVKLTGDTNTVHIGDNAIVHGMLIVSFISTFIGTILPGNGAVWVASNINFVRPLHVEDEIVISGYVGEKIDRLKRVKLYIDVHNQNNEVCIMSTCWVNISE
jgi:3-oxoacyl-[acyl-carrier protein] reductase